MYCIFNFVKTLNICKQKDRFIYFLLILNIYNLRFGLSADCRLLTYKSKIFIEERIVQKNSLNLKIPREFL